MGVKATLRREKISNNRYSLYIDFYPEIISPKNGKKTRREYLKMYILENPKTSFEKQSNKEILQLAEQILHTRLMQYNKAEIYTGFEKDQLRLKELGEQNFVEYFKKLSEKRKNSNYDNWYSAYKYLNSFTNGSIKFCELNVQFFEDFKEYLLSTKSNKSNKVKLSQNSASSYFNKIKATLKQAFKEEYLSVDLNAKIGSIKPAETMRNFLTQEELYALVKTECQNPLLKRVALFSAVTGLRFSDIKKLKWDEFEYSEDKGGYLYFKQKKTEKVERIPISDEAIQLMGERRDKNENVFEGLEYSAYNNKHLYQWIGASGITKDITFHCFRHTYATLQLSQKIDITTVSKMLGHKDLKTTLQYAKVVDQSKVETTTKIKLGL
jgi:integrase